MDVSGTCTFDPHRHVGLAMTATGNETLFKHLDRQHTKLF